MTKKRWAFVLIAVIVGSLTMMTTLRAFADKERSTGIAYSAPTPSPVGAIASAARTTTGTGTAFTVGPTRELIGDLTISAASGTTPTLDLKLQTSTNGGTTWYDVGAYTQKTGTGTDSRVFGPLGTTARWSWTIAGDTPSFTFKVVAKRRVR